MLKEKIIKTAEQLFTAYGVKRISMDEISAKAGVSKRTIYEQYKDKSALVSQLINQILNQFQTALEENKALSHDAIEENYNTLKHIEHLSMEVSPSFTYDLRKYHPECWKEVEFFRNYLLKNMIRDNIQRGIQEGWFKEDLNIEVMTELRLLILAALFNPENSNLQHKNLKTVSLLHTEHFMYGIASKEGLELIEHYKNQNKYKA